MTTLHKTEKHIFFVDLNVKVNKFADTDLHNLYRYSVYNGKKTTTTTTEKLQIITIETLESHDSWRICFINDY